MLGSLVEGIGVYSSTADFFRGTGDGGGSRLEHSNGGAKRPLPLITIHVYAPLLQFNLHEGEQIFFGQFAGAPLPVCDEANIPANGAVLPTHPADLGALEFIDGRPATGHESEHLGRGREHLAHRRVRGDTKLIVEAEV